MVSNKLNNTKMEKKRLPLYSVKEMCNAFDKLLEQNCGILAKTLLN
jgi:hypothetical protein